MNFLNPFLFFILREGQFIVWDYINHQQFELTEAYINRLLEISSDPSSHNEIDIELTNSKLILNVNDENEEWGWDCLSKIFHFGTSIQKSDLHDISINDPVAFCSEYITFSEKASATSPPILIEKNGFEIQLPTPNLSLFEKQNFLSVLTKRKTCRTFYNEPLSLDVVSTLLYVSFGAFHKDQTEYHSIGLDKVGLRKTSPAGGGLHASEAYILAQNIEGIPKGIYHYQAHSHILTLINSEDFTENLKEIFCGQYFIEQISLGVFITSRFEKLWHKYPHSRAYRIALLDVGHLSQTFQLVATALTLNPWLSGAFVDDEVRKMLKLKRLCEQPLFFVGAGLGPWQSIDPVTRELALKGDI